MEGKPVVAYIVSKQLAKISSSLPSNRMRSFMVHSLVNSMGLFAPDYSKHARIQVIPPRLASYNELTVYHTREYLDFVLSPTNSHPEVSVSENDDEPLNLARSFGLEDDCPPFQGLPEYVQLVGGASLTAASTLRQGKVDIAICWDGGRHHAQKSHASGFCYVADCILVLLALKRAATPSPDNRFAQKPRIMYLDLDLHFSDAVSQAFVAQNASHTPQILTLSIHHTSPGFFPATALAELPSVDKPTFDPFTLSLPLRRGASNATYARIWPLVEGIKDTFNPDYIVVQCGVDALAGDPFATFNWSLGGAEGSLGWCIQRVKEWKGRKLFLGGGGYHSANAARAWTYLTSILLGRPLSLEAEIPEHSAFPLYAPSFTLDVSPGNMRNENTDDYLSVIERCFQTVDSILKRRLSIPNSVS